MAKEKINKAELKRIQSQYPISLVNYFLLPKTFFILVATIVVSLFLASHFGKDFSSFIFISSGITLAVAYLLYDLDYKRNIGKYPHYYEEKTILAKILKYLDR